MPAKPVPAPEIEPEFEKREIRFNMVLTPEEHLRLRVAAKKAGMTMSAWARHTLRRAWESAA